MHSKITRFVFLGSFFVLWVGFSGLALAAEAPQKRIPAMDPKAGKLKNYLHEPLRADEILDRLELRRGKAATEINGVKVNKDRWVEQFRKLKPVPNKSAQLKADEELIRDL